MWWMLLAGCFLLPGGAEVEGDEAGECTDGADNDGDGMFDCFDADCELSPDCTTTGLITGAATGAATGGATGAATGAPTGTNTGTTTGSTGTTTGTTTFGTAIDYSTLIGRTWAVDVNSLYWVEPAGIGPLIGGLFDGEPLLAVDGGTATSLDFMYGEGDGGVQNFCSPTIDFPVSADYSGNPMFELDLTGSALSMDVQGLTITIDDAYFSGVFTQNGSRIEQLQVAGSLDTRPLNGYVGADVCDLLVTLGVSCVPCPDGSGPFCLDVIISDGQATEVGFPLYPIGSYTADYLDYIGYCTGGGTLCSTVSIALGGGPLGLVLVMGAAAARRRREH